MLVETLRRHFPRERILHDIYENISNERGRRLDLRSLCHGFTGVILFIAQHGDHYHVIYDCAPIQTPLVDATPSINCSELTKPISAKILSKNCFEYRSFTIRHWIHLAVYLEKGGRQVEYLCLSGRTWIPSCETRHLQFQRDCRWWRSLNGGRKRFIVPPFLLLHLWIQRTYWHSDFSARQRRTYRKADKIVLFIKKYPAAPVTSFFSSSNWLKSNYKFVDIKSNLIRTCIRIVNN